MCRLVNVNPPVYFSSEIGSPVAFGFRKPVILVPESFREMPHDFQRAISCHELWHVRRNDWLFSLLEEVAVAISWFHPLCGGSCESNSRTSKSSIGWCLRPLMSANPTWRPCADFSPAGLDDHLLHFFNSIRQ
jgi:hypothetical protein